MASLRRLESPRDALPVAQLQRSGLSERVTALAQGPDAALATVAKSLVQQWLVRKPTRGRRERREAACNEAAPRASRCRAS
jgi:hypothetical protein